MIPRKAYGMGSARKNVSYSIVPCNKCGKQIKKARGCAEVCGKCMRKK